MRDIEGPGRTQRLLLPDRRDDSVTAEHPGRFRDADVARRDLVRLGCARAHAACTGRPAYDPRDVLTRSISGYLNRRRSRRRRERATQRHVERIGLLRQLRPACTTMADVRKHHPNALPALCRECVLLCRPLDRLGAERLASDGRQFTAVNTTHQHLTPANLAQARKAREETAEQSGRDLDPAEREDASGHHPTTAELQETIERRQARQQRDRGCVQALTARGETPLALTDPARRALPKSPQVAVGDNVPLAVERQHTLMGAQDVTNALTADEPLRPMAMSAKATRGVERMRAGADLGDAHGQAINACAAAGRDADVPQPSRSANTTRGLLGQARCTDDPDTDGYRGPARAELTCRCETTELGRPSRSDATGACRRGPLKAPCPSNTAGRRMTRGVDEPSRERLEERRNATPARMPEREQRVEHPGGTLTPANDPGSCRMKRRKHVRADFSRSCVASHLTRVIHSLGVPPRRGALSEGGHRRAVCPR